MEASAAGFSSQFIQGQEEPLDPDPGPWTRTLDRPLVSSSCVFLNVEMKTQAANGVLSWVCSQTETIGEAFRTRRLQEGRNDFR